MVMKNEINNYINKKCYDCCHFKKENMELYKLNLPNDIVNNIIRYNYDEECYHCYIWECNKEYSPVCVEYILAIKEMLKKMYWHLLLFITMPYHH